MAVSRSREAGGAVMAITIDSRVPESAIEQIREIDGFDQAWFAALDVD